jgi:hypothetical protein
MPRFQSKGVVIPLYDVECPISCCCCIVMIHCSRILQHWSRRIHCSSGCVVHRRIYIHGIFPLYAH